MTTVDPLDAFAIGLQLGALASPEEPVTLDVESARAWLRGARTPGGRPFTALERGMAGASPRVALGVIGADGVVRAARWVRLRDVPAWLAARHATEAVVAGCP